MSESYVKQNQVMCTRCDEYEVGRLEEIVESHFAALGLTPEHFAHKRVMLKPNLVTPHAPEAAVSTHPTLVEAAARLMRRYGAEVIIAESPGGPYTESALRRSYQVSGMKAAAEAAGVPLNTDVSFGTFQTPRGVLCHTFDMITPALQADVILNLCKLKTHSLTLMTAAAKNLFGTMPGLRKVEMHALFSDQERFQSALVDLCDGLCAQKEVISVCDAVVGMEGNGPSGGSPRAVGCVLTSLNPFALDAAGEQILGLRGEVIMVREARKRGLLSSEAPVIVGNPLPTYTDWEAPDSRMKKMLTGLPPFLRPHPVIRSKICIGCGKCAESCPAHTITLQARKDGKRRAVIHRNACLRCFCCQEMCPAKAIDTHKNLVFRIVH